MRPDRKSNRLLGVTRSKAKMIEYHVPEDYQDIALSLHPNKLFTITIGLLGDLAAAMNREEPDPDSLAEMKSNLLFSARFFDSYLQSKLNETLDPYLVLLGSASYYLCDLPGSASVLAKHIDGDCPDLDCDGLENLLLWLLQADLGTYFDGAEGPFGGFIDGISKWILQFFEDGNGEENLFDFATKLRDAVYESGTPMQLLFGDVIAAVLRNLLSIFDPIKSDDEKYTITMEALDFAKAYIDDPDEVAKLAAGIAAQHGDKNFSRDGVERQVAWRISLICAVESFLLSHWDESEDGLSEADVTRLAEGTLAFFLADDQKKEHIRELFQLLAKNIATNITDPARRKIYGRTLYGIQDAQAIEGWVQSNADSLLSIVDETEVLDLAWPLLTRHINGGVFTKFDKPDVLKEISHGWIRGKPFSDLLEIIRKRKAKMIWGTRRREFKIDHVVEVCEGTLAYNGTLIVGAVCEFIEHRFSQST